MLTISCNYHKINEKPNAKVEQLTFLIHYVILLVEYIVIIEPFREFIKLDYILGSDKCIYLKRD